MKFLSSTTLLIGAFAEQVTQPTRVPTLRIEEPHLLLDSQPDYWECAFEWLISGGETSSLLQKQNEIVHVRSALLKFKKK